MSTRFQLNAALYSFKLKYHEQPCFAVLTVLQGGPRGKIHLDVNVVPGILAIGTDYNSHLLIEYAKTYASYEILALM